MKKTTTRILSLLLLLSISIGYLSYARFDMMQLACKIAASIHRSDAEALTTIKVPVKDFARDSNKEEIWVNGSLYDLHSYVIINDTALVSVHRDKEEESLITSIVSVFQANDQYARNDGRDHISKYKPFVPDGKILSTPYGLVVRHFYVAPSFPVSTTSFVADYRSASVIKPPPDNISVTVLC